MVKVVTLCTLKNILRRDPFDNPDNQEYPKVNLHCTNAASTWCKYFRIFHPAILVWNPASESLSRSPSAKLWLAALTIMFATGTGACMFNVTHSSYFALIHVMFSTCLIPCSWCVAGSGVVFYNNCDDFVLVFARMRHLLEQLEWRISQRKNFWDSFDKRWKIMNLFLRMTIYALLPMAWILPFFLTYEDLDPHYSFQKYYLDFPLSTPVQIVLITTRCLLLLISFAEGVRTYGIAITTLFMWLEMQARCILDLRQLPTRGRWKHNQSDEFLKWYAKFQIVFSTWEEAVANWVRVLLGCLFTMIVVCGVATIKYFGDVPISVFWFVPACAIINISVICLIFPCLAGLHEGTRRLLWKEKYTLKPQNFLSQFELKVARKRLQSLRPIAIRCGTQFPLKLKTKAIFYGLIMQRILDGVLFKL